MKTLGKRKASPSIENIERLHAWLHGTLLPKVSKENSKLIRAKGHRQRERDRSLIPVDVLGIESDLEAELGYIVRLEIHGVMVLADASIQLCATQAETIAIALNAGEEVDYRHTRLVLYKRVLRFWRKKVLEIRVPTEACDDLRNRWKCYRLSDDIRSHLADVVMHLIRERDVEEKANIKRMQQDGNIRLSRLIQTLEESTQHEQT